MPFRDGGLRWTSWRIRCWNCQPAPFGIPRLSLAINSSSKGTMRKLLAIPALLVLTSACTHKTMTAHGTVPVPSTAVHTTMQHQVMNAVDAGEGDVEMRRLREKVAAEPDNVEARLALAAHYGARGFRDLE